MAWSKDSIVHLLVVDSTNCYVRDEAVALWQNRGISDFAVVTAGHQTAGRGQRGNTWNSNAGENLLFSILVRPGETLEVSKQFLLSQAVALSIHDAMKCHGIDTQLKWPNDIYAGNRKLAGILLELDYSGAFVEQAIIGIGLNVNQENFPPMDRTPVSMKMMRKAENGKRKTENGKLLPMSETESLLSHFTAETRVSVACDDGNFSSPKECDKVASKQVKARLKQETGNRKQREDFILDDVLATILDLFEHYYTEMRFGNRDAIAAEYKRVLLGMNERHTFIDKDGHFEAVIQDIESDGHLILRRNDGSTGRYAFKEVEMVLF